MSNIFFKRPANCNVIKRRTYLFKSGCSVCGVFRNDFAVKNTCFCVNFLLCGEGCVCYVRNAIVSDGVDLVSIAKTRYQTFNGSLLAYNVFFEHCSNVCAIHKVVGVIDVKFNAVYGEVIIFTVYSRKLAAF